LGIQLKTSHSVIFPSFPPNKIQSFAIFRLENVDT
jgi:hypothetical protein